MMFPSQQPAMPSSNASFSLCPSHQLLLLPPFLSQLRPCNRGQMMRTRLKQPLHLPQQLATL